MSDDKLPVRLSDADVIACLYTPLRCAGRPVVSVLAKRTCALNVLIHHLNAFTNHYFISCFCPIVFLGGCCCTVSMLSMNFSFPCRRFRCFCSNLTWLVKCGQFVGLVWSGSRRNRGGCTARARQHWGCHQLWPWRLPPVPVGYDTINAFLVPLASVLMLLCDSDLRHVLLDTGSLWARPVVYWQSVRVL